MKRLSVFASAAALAAALLLGAAVPAAGETPAALASSAGAGGARNLSLAPHLSFTDDSSDAFPIRGENLDDGRIASDRPTVVFFGTSHCWNTNREAERLVALSAKAKDAARFLVVDLGRPSAGQRALIARLYRGAIPTVAFLDARGRIVYDEAGETASRRGDTARLEELLRQAQ
ncbi:MAG: hypothetical protein ABI592_07250 [Acidobacteriota bacterium]